MNEINIKKDNNFGEEIKLFRKHRTITVKHSLKNPLHHFTYILHKLIHAHIN